MEYLEVGVEIDLEIIDYFCRRNSRIYNEYASYQDLKSQKIIYLDGKLRNFGYGANLCMPMKQDHILEAWELTNNDVIDKLPDIMRQKGLKVSSNHKINVARSIYFITQNTPF